MQFAENSNMSPHLGIEYRQWRFSKELQEFFRKTLLKCTISDRAHERVAREAKTILERWILSLNQVNKVYDPQLPLYPIIEEDDPMNSRLVEDLIEKKYVWTVGKGWEIVNQLLDVIKDFRVLCAENADPEEPHCEEVEDGREKSKVIVGEFETPYSIRFRPLIQKFGLYATACMLLRYESAGSGSYQWGDPVSVHRLYYLDFGARYEGFASPLNSRFLGQDGARFCSVFPDTDAAFGSMGNFFDVDLMDYQGGWTVNPPFIETVLKDAAKRVISALEMGANSYFFLNFPNWIDCEGWMLLNECPYKHDRFDFEAGEFLIQDAYGKSLKPRMKLSLFVVGRLPPGSPSVEKVRETVYRPK